MPHTTMTLRSILLDARSRLEQAGVDAPALCADLLLCHALGLRRVDLVMERTRPVTADEHAAIDALLTRRATGEPLAYITGVREFFGREFAVTPDTLIPRPETEHLVECALTELRPGPALFADGGTGSGCIAVTLCAERDGLSGLAIDRSPGALAVARSNARRHNVDNRLLFLNGDFTLPCLRPASLDLYVTNPPYISAAEHATLSPEVRTFEPITALVPGDTGLEHAKALIAHASSALRPDGIFLMEFGCTQGPDVEALFEPFASLWATVDIRRDLAGLDRFVLAKRSPAR